MDGSRSNLRLYPAAAADPSAEFAPLPANPDAHDLANRELIRPFTYRRGHRGQEPFSAAWYDELEQKRYHRHGDWLNHALEFGRHPGESVLLLGPGLGSDAVRYLRSGTEVTIATTAADHPDLIRENLARHGLAARIVPTAGHTLPFPDGLFDVAVWNALYEPDGLPAARVDELYRVLKNGGKLIGLFPAYYDAGFWQDRLLPWQHLYWHRPPDPTAAPKTTRRGLLRTFARFAEHRVRKRHLRRSELPHPWRVWPLAVLERLIGRVLVLKTFKPIWAARTNPNTSPDSLAA